MKKIKGYLWPTLLALAVAIGIFIGGKLHFNDSPEKLFSTNSKKDKLNRLIDYIDYEYVDEIDTDSIVDVTVNNILGKLDPHSVYIPKSEMKEVSENMKGDFAGIGVSFYMFRDTITVIRTIKNGPSYISGIRPGDRILMADKDTLFGRRIPNDDVVATLKGKVGTKVNLKVYRKSENKMMDVSVTRDRVPIRSVDGYYMLTKDIGYIKINRFAESTFGEFKDALKKLKLRGAEKLVLDLRDNPGGYLGIAEKLADEFLSEDKLILFTKNKKGRIKKAFATDKGDFEDKPVYVLINERSASASEIIAGALQDNDIGTIVGRRSFGKGLVQREMDLGDGSAVRLTVSRYYTPTGRSIQRSYKDGNRDYYHKFMERYSSGELISADSIKVADSLRFVTPKGKVVYGGGGIIPDVFVPIGSNEEEAIESMDDTYQFFSRFVFEHLEEDRTRYSGYDHNQFLDEFTVDDILFDQFIQFVLDRKVKLDFYAYEEKIKAYLKANIAEQLFSPNLSAQIKGDFDAMLMKVKELDAEAFEKSQVGAVNLNR
ncbi:carboxyl-terminal processing protease [Flagellimonas taeanensis]|uniref:Carboxyl-terminal processing protease n=1 Tax=Flagellimonas taeanensis TaxID=1005926 RepID=A0A1M6XVW2_9FLAO|nr:S41 family peptidase [Allomuricauda taeanensis]MEE1961758.1 S41 family peptidase [Allomuricauda taeanensis]SFC03452.1 carboxyl-terminal processing protease [Allomuricauda taeanensis]SHL10019.1 carboxyl-terminal processing protease [Allomuricauda taeanensis]